MKLKCFWRRSPKELCVEILYLHIVYLHCSLQGEDFVIELSVVIVALSLET